MYTTALPTIETTRQVVVLTDKGHAARALYRFVHAVRELEAEDRAYVIAMLADELRQLIADPA